MPDSARADQTSAPATQQPALRRRVQASVSSALVFRGLCVLTLAAVVGDLVTTVYGLELGLREQNPFVRGILAHFGVPGLVGIKVVALLWAGLIWHALGRRYGAAAMAGLVIPQGTAVVLNVVTILTA